MALSRKATALLVCDMQDRFKSAIYKFGAVSATSARVIRFAKVELWMKLVQRRIYLGPVFSSSKYRYLSQNRTREVGGLFRVLLMHLLQRSFEQQRWVQPFLN
jgi:hypothetical protein